MLKVILRKKYFTVLALLLMSVFFSAACGLSTDNSNFLKEKINKIDEAKLVSCKANLRNIDSAVAVYYAENQAYPQSLNELNVDENVKKCPIDNSDMFIENVGGKTVAKCSHGHTSQSDS